MGEAQATAREPASTDHVLVIGGAGYVGSVLVQELLARGHSVRILDALVHGEPSLLFAWGRPSFDFLQGEGRNSTRVATAVEGVSTVVRLAAVVGDPAYERVPELTKRTNVEATSRLLDAASAAGVRRFVFLSTCSNYGKMADPNAYVTEDSSSIRFLSLPRRRWRPKTMSRLVAHRPFKRAFFDWPRSTACHRECGWISPSTNSPRSVSREAVGRLRESVLAFIHPRPRCRVGALRDLSADSPVIGGKLFNAVLPLRITGSGPAPPSRPPVPPGRHHGSSR